MTHVQAANIQREATEARRFAGMGPDALALAWWVHVCPPRDGAPKTADPLCRPLVKLRMAELGMTYRDCAMRCVKAGLIAAADVEVAG